jgi:Flp pilus assembly pilin Flp
MPRIVTYGRRLLADQSGTALIGYSSIMLLVAIAAIAVLTQFQSGANLSGATFPPDSRIDSLH